MNGQSVIRTSDNGNAVHIALEEFGRSMSLEKKSGAWYRHGDEVTVIVDAQKSQYGPKYYINLSFWLQVLEERRYPKPHMCHISTRLETFVQADRERIGNLLDLEYEMSSEARRIQLVEVLDQKLRPLIDEGSSLDGLRKLIADGTLKSAAIRGSAQDVLA